MFLLSILAAIFLRIYLISRDSVPFAYDMGRDLLWTKDISFYHIPTLIGPAASIWGVYFGPLWYYFLAFPLLVTNGHPLSAVFTTASTIIAAGFLAFLLFKKYLGKFWAHALTVFILFGTTLVNISTFAFHANVLPLLTLLLIYFSFLSKTNAQYLFFATFCVSLMFHADPAPGIVFTAVPIFMFFFLKLYKAKNLPKIIISNIIAYILPFLPQILFELRNNFVQTKSLIAYFSGENPSLSGQLSLLERIPNRLSIYFDYFKAGIAGESSIAATFLVAFIFIGSYLFLKKEKDPNLRLLFKISTLIFLITFFIFTFVISVEVKSWYLNGLPVIFALLLIFALYGFRFSKTISGTLIIAYVVMNILPFTRSERILKSKSDPAQLENQLEAVSTIYEDAEGSSFSVYTFTPVIYDYSYQYLFWWKGTRLKKGLPDDFAYLPNQPAYVRNKDNYANYARSSDTIYLIIENSRENEFYTKKDWLNNFKSYKTVWEKEINGAVTLQKRSK